MVKKKNDSLRLRHVKKKTRKNYSFQNNTWGKNVKLLTGEEFSQLKTIVNTVIVNSVIVNTVIVNTVATFTKKLLNVSFQL